MSSTCTKRQRTFRARSAFQSVKASTRMSHSVRSHALSSRSKWHLQRHADHQEEVPYVIPTFCSRKKLPVNVHERRMWGMSSLREDQQRMRILFANELAKIEEGVLKVRHIVLERTEMSEMRREIRERLEYERKIIEARLIHAPNIGVPLRSHIVWEHMGVKLTCVVFGSPEPKVTWYKDNMVINPKLEPGRFRITSAYGVHSLQIGRCELSDTAQYSISAVNNKGKASCEATLVVKQFRSTVQELTSGSLYDWWLLTPSEAYFDISLLGRFPVSFGHEGETLHLGCSVLIHPPVPDYQPKIQWFRDGMLLEDSQWFTSKWDGERASIDLHHLNKEDEGLYSLKVTAGKSSQDYSAYVFVQDAEAFVAGAPGAPLEVTCQDINRDYAVICWKHPSDDGGSTITGYYVERREQGHNEWQRCNTTPTKLARFPVTGLSEGRRYEFRVRALNQRGLSRPSRVSEPITTLDPTEQAHNKLSWIEKILASEEQIDGTAILKPPVDVSVIEASKDYIVLGWKPPKQGWCEGLTYYIEKLSGDGGVWERVNLGSPAHSPRFTMFNLNVECSYYFRVRACSSGAISEPSEPAGPIRLGDRLGVPSPPGQALPIRHTDTSVALSWEPTTDTEDLLGYYVDCCEEGTDKWLPCNNKPIQDTKFIAHGLTTGKKYMFRVRAMNAAGMSAGSPASEYIQVFAALACPSAPYDLSLLASTCDSMVISWKAPKTNGGACISAYFIDYREVCNGEPGSWMEGIATCVTPCAYQVKGLKDGQQYQFCIRAANIVGVGHPSESSETFTCCQWTMPEPGPPHELVAWEVQDTSLVMRWRPPVYEGKGPITGYWMEMAEVGADDLPGEWQPINNTAITNTRLKVDGLEKGKNYVFRVKAQNSTALGKASECSDPVCTTTRPETRAIQTGVDEEGNIFLELECPATRETSTFIWEKDYEDPDASRTRGESDGTKGRLYLLRPSEKDLGTYSCMVTDTNGYSASIDLDKDELERLLEISHEKKHPRVPLVSDLNVELLERGRVRFWLQAKCLGPAATAQFYFNNRMITSDKKYDVRFDRESGLVEMFMDSFAADDMGTYTVQLHDEKANTQSSLILIGDVFDKLLSEAEFLRREWIRKQGPHFAEYLRWEVTEHCDVLLLCKVANIRKDTKINWFKDDSHIMEEKDHDFESGVFTFLIAQITRENAGIYKVHLKDNLGEDTSTLRLMDEVFDELMKEVARYSAESATPLKMQPTAEGIKLYSNVTFYPEELKISWFQRNTKLASTDKTRSGVTHNQIWLLISDPNDRDKGRYNLELFDGKKTHQRTIELAGDDFDEAVAEYQRLKAAALAEKNRARVVGGLPDVVAIQEGKTLNLTCSLWGDPTPEVCWMHNDRELELDEHFSTKFEDGRHAAFTIRGIHTEHSGKYSIRVRNKYGGETGDFTVSVYRPEDMAEEVEGSEGSGQRVPG
uniref:myomesin-1-like n=1 Tax=Myxine glutinosa TaxID=7769 RepID=UPI00358E19DF